MVIIGIKAELGNVMFQYAFGRIIAEKKGYKLLFDESLAYVRMEEFFKTFPNATIPDGKEVVDNIMFVGCDLQHLDLNTVLNHSGGVHLQGYWQKHHYYFPYRDQIREWFKYDDSMHEKPDVDDIVVHYRAKFNPGIIAEYITPVPKFLEILKRLDYKNCVIVTDLPMSPQLDVFKTELKNVVVRAGTLLEDFTYMKYAKRLVLAQSTFSWWAAFLGNPDKVYAPMSLVPAPCCWKAYPDVQDIDLIPLNNTYEIVKF